MPVGHFSIVSSPVFGPSQRHAPFWSFHDSPELNARKGSFRNIFASIGRRRRRRQLEYEDNVSISGDRTGRGGHNDRWKPDLIRPFDAAIAAFVDLAAVKCRREGYQGREPKAKAPRFLPPLSLLFFFFLFQRGLTDHLYRWSMIAALSGSSTRRRATERNRPPMQPLWRI